MNRRRFLQHSGALAVAGATTSLIGAGCASEPSPDSLLIAQPALQTAFGLTLVREIGQLYLKNLAPAQRSASALRAALAEDANAGGWWPWSPPSTLESLVAADFESDPDAGRLVLPGGWVLSVTEARQCALAALAAT